MTCTGDCNQGRGCDCTCEPSDTPLNTDTIVFALCFVLASFWVGVQVGESNVTPCAAVPSQTHVFPGRKEGERLFAYYKRVGWAK